MSDAKTMTNKERAQKAAYQRWHSCIPKASHSGILNIGGKEIACDVLEDGRRVLRTRTFLKAIGKSRPSGTVMRGEDNENIPVFVRANNLKKYLGKAFEDGIKIIKYKAPNGQNITGYEAKVLPEVCKVYVTAYDDGILQDNQLKTAVVCRAILYGLATVGIVSLIDDATGYVHVREKSELQRILEKYISEELREWTKKFPDEFFKQTYRLYNWEYPKVGKNHPQYIGKIINKYVYDRLPPGVLEELKKKNPANENGNRNYRHHQFLSENVGEENLNKQIHQVITLMKVSDNLDQFKELIERI